MCGFLLDLQFGILGSEYDWQQSATGRACRRLLVRSVLTKTARFGLLAALHLFAPPRQLAIMAPPEVYSAAACGLLCMLRGACPMLALMTFGREIIGRIHTECSVQHSAESPLSILASATSAR